MTTHSPAIETDAPGASDARLLGPSDTHTSSASDAAHSEQDQPTDQVRRIEPAAVAVDEAPPPHRLLTGVQHALHGVQRRLAPIHTWGQSHPYVSLAASVVLGVAAGGMVHKVVALGAGVGMGVLTAWYLSGPPDAAKDAAAVRRAP